MSRVVEKAMTGRKAASGEAGTDGRSAGSSPAPAPIRSLDIRNFQSWREGHFDFHPGINILIGTSRHGKSAALRALRWVVENKPTGDAFRRWGSKRTEVSVTVSDSDDDAFIERGRTASKNSYLVKEAISNSGQLDFEAFGQDVPEDVRRVLDIDPINCQWQHDRPFLLSETSGEIARQLNRIARLDKIDSAQANIASMKRTNDGKIKQAAAAVENLQESLEQFQNLPVFEKEVRHLESLQSKTEKIRRVADDLTAINNSVCDVENELKQYPNIKEAAGLCVNLEGAVDDLSVLQRRISDLRQLGASISSTRIELEKVVEITAAEKDVEQLIVLCEDLKLLRRQIAGLDVRATDVRQEESNLDDACLRLEELSQKWTKKAPKTCPLCDGKGELR